MRNIYNMAHMQSILIIDFGSQYTQLIARRIRELGVYCEIHSYLITPAEIKQLNPAGIILSGGPDSVLTPHSPRAPEIIFTLGIPVLGVCYGMQTMAVQLGGEVIAGIKREFGYAQVTLTTASALFAQIEDHRTDEGEALLDVWMSHGDQVSVLPVNFHTIAKTNNCAIAAMADQKRHFYGIQFHPEVSHTKQGMRILQHFLFTICHCQATWTLQNIITEQMAAIKAKVGEAGVILGLSGGVDSAVAAVLLHKAIGSQLTCVFVDTGLLRLHEVEHVKTLFAEAYGIRLIIVDAKEQFYQALVGISDPEAKRKMIGKVFIDVFNAQAKQIKNNKWLAQGTIYSDVIESAATKTGKGHAIKSHHNVGGLPEKMQLGLIEPLRELFKDEVRRLGLELGLPHELVYRHPFPGPGLAVRVLGEVKQEYLEKLRLADQILIEELMQANLYYDVSQAFAVFLPVKSVGVIGDARQYAHVIAIRVVETIDFMTATWAHLPYAVLEKISNRIINEIAGISRVTYDISSKPPATIEWE